MIKFYIKRLIYAILFFAGVLLFYKLLKLTELKNDLLSVTIALVTVYIAYKQYCVEASKNKTAFLQEKITLINDLSQLMKKIQNYEIDLDKRKISIQDIINEIYKLDIKDGSEIEVYCVVVLQNPLEDSKVHFLAPIILNHTNKKAIQLVLSPYSYPEFAKLESLKSFAK